MRRFLTGQQFLVVYSGILTVAFAITLFTAFSRSGPQKFKEIEVQRINLTEPDGTLRLIISNKALAPGIIIKGQDHPHPTRKTAGMIFFNEEGTENGGLTFDGDKSQNGTERSSGHLSFDRYEQDQVLKIESNQEGRKRETGLKLIDQPEYPIQELLAIMDRTSNLPPRERDAEIEKFMQLHGSPHTRLSLYRTSEGGVELKMKDPEGRDRLVLEVTADGTPALRLLDQRGNVLAQLPPAK
jgi:hypothetical protein